jgi:hypothetical protein
MRAILIRLPASFVLLSALAACSAGSAPEDDAAEQEQAIAAAANAAASAAAPPPANGAADAAPPALTCDASQVQGLVGKKADDTVAEQARTDAGAARVRLLHPDQMVTMEFDSERLSLEVDATGQIVAVRCG